MKKVITILGARPQFIKSLPLSKELQNIKVEEIVVHTGQHYDYEMSQVFFDTMDLKKPKYHLGIGSLSHGAQTGRMLEKIEEVLKKEKPSGVIVYGDTNSTLAAALAAVKLHIPVFHIEAGLRSFKRNMPEEINRVLTDHISSLLFPPSDMAVKNLRKEGITKGVYKTGDIMYDTFKIFKESYKKRALEILKKLDLKENNFALATIHREENSDDRKKFNSILDGLKRIASEGIEIVLPAHPRIQKILPPNLKGVKIIKPLSYIDLQALLTKCKIVLTDSGGLQKEAYFHKKPCITLREETEWVELKKSGVNVVAGWKSEKIHKSFKKMVKQKLTFAQNIYGEGRSALKIAKVIKCYIEGGLNGQ